MSIMSELKLSQASLERENMELRSCQYNNNTDMKKSVMMQRMSPQPQLTSTPVQHGGNQVSQAIIYSMIKMLLLNLCK